MGLDLLDTLSLRQLRLFETVYRTRNVSAAAEALHTGQPSVSLSLCRLRRQFADPLFVRVGSRMEPTARAEALIGGVRAILAIAGGLAEPGAFDPPTSGRRFTLHMTDPAETLLMPPLVKRLARAAPAVRLRVREVGDDSAARLADGEVDLIADWFDACTISEADRLKIGRTNAQRLFKLDADT